MVRRELHFISTETVHGRLGDGSQESHLYELAGSQAPGMSVRLHFRFVVAKPNSCYDANSGRNVYRTCKTYMLLKGVTLEQSICWRTVHLLSMLVIGGRRRNVVTWKSLTFFLKQLVVSL